MASSSSDISSAIGKSTRTGFGTVTPYLIVESIDPFVTFLQNAFGGKETYRSQGKGGGWHCEVQIGDTMIMIGGDRPLKKDSTFTPVPITLFLYVADIDTVYKAAIAAGGKSQMEPIDDFAGNNARGASIIDPFGNTWYMATEKATTSPN